MRACFWTVAAVIGVAGCGTPEAHPPMGFKTGSVSKCQKTDNANDCRIMVDITSKDNGKGCDVKVRDSQADVGFKRNAQGRTIRWQIDSAPVGDYQFTTNGVAPKSAADAWNANFKDGKPIGDGKTYQWKNENTAPGVYEYFVTVVSEDGVSCKSDPVIRNQS